MNCLGLQQMDTRFIRAYSMPLDPTHCITFLSILFYSDSSSTFSLQTQVQLWRLRQGKVNEHAIIARV